MSERQRLRRHAKTIRRNLSPAARSTAAEKAVVNLTQTEFYRRALHIACYLATPEEIDTRVLIERLWHDGKHCYLPCIDAADAVDDTLTFALWRRSDMPVKNRCGIWQPADDAARRDASQLQLIVMPIVAFDRQGRRLGTGGGYYDRTLAAVRSRPLLCGLAYAGQEASCIPSEPWDIDMDAIVTECEVIIVPAGRLP